MTDADSVTVRPLQAADADAIVRCFRRVYGDSYANELFYDPARLTAALAAGSLHAVGAHDADGRLIGHMAMQHASAGGVAELGNTVVDPDYRGAGIAWRVGAALTRWCADLGCEGFLHYPTSQHHIMQRESVKQGHETGVMLGYVPAETDSGVGRPDQAGRQAARHAARQAGRPAATVVFQPLTEPAEATSHLPERYADLIRDLAAAAGIPRTWTDRQGGRAQHDHASHVERDVQPKRGLVRLRVHTLGADLDAQLRALESTDYPVRQIDLALRDPGIDRAVELARDHGYLFCGWLPGTRHGDRLRLQHVLAKAVDMHPGLVNPTALNILDLIHREVALTPA